MTDINIKIGVIADKSIKVAQKALDNVNKTLKNVTVGTNTASSASDKLKSSYSKVATSLKTNTKKINNHTNSLKNQYQQYVDVNKILNKTKSIYSSTVAHVKKLKKVSKNLSTVLNAVNKRVKASASRFKKMIKGLKDTAKASTFLKNAMAVLLGYVGGRALVGAFSMAASAVKEFAKTAIQSASDAEEIESKFGVVFGSVADKANASMKDLASNYGLSRTAARELLGDTGDLLSGFGFTGGAALDLSTKVQKLAVDLASFTNYSGGAKGASEALTKALLGEREQAKMLGIAILEADVKKQMSINKSKGLTFATERQAKAYATLDLAMAQSKNAMGDFARTSGQFANQQRILSNRFQDVSETIGKTFLPIAKTALVVINNRLEENIEVIGKWSKVFTTSILNTTKGVISAVDPIVDVLVTAGQAIRLVFNSITAGLKAISAAIVLPFTLAVSAINEAIKLLPDAIVPTSWKTNAEIAAGTLKDTMRDLVYGINEDADDMGDALSTVGKAWTNDLISPETNKTITNTLDSMLKGVEAVGKETKKVTNEIKKEAGKAVEKTIKFKTSADFRALEGLEEKLKNIGKTELEIHQGIRDQQLKFLDTVFTQQGKNTKRYKDIRFKIEQDFKNKKAKIEEDLAKKKEDLAKQAHEREKKRIAAEASYRQALASARAGVSSNVGATSNLQEGMSQIFGGKTPEAQKGIDSAFDQASSQLQSGQITQEQFNLEIANLDQVQSDLKTSSMLGFGAGLAGAVAQGAKGAGEVIKAGLTVAATAAFGPMAGQVMEAAGPLLDALMQGPEAVKQLVQEFAAALPQLVTALIDAIPVFITEFARQIPNIIDGLIAALPNLINALIIGIIEGIPRIVYELTVGLILAIPTLVMTLLKAVYVEAPKTLGKVFKNLGKKIIDGLKDALKSVGSIFKKLFKFKGGGKGAVEKFIHLDFPFVKFAKGGLVGGKTKAGTDSEANDKIPALLSAGEIVIPKSVARGPLEGIMDYIQTLGVKPIKLGLRRQWNKLKEGVTDRATKVQGDTLGGLSKVSNIVMKITSALSKIPVVGRVFKGIHKFQELIDALLKLGMEVDIPRFVVNPLDESKRIIKEGKEKLKPHFKKLINPAKALGFAEGGLVSSVPSGYPNDTFPARLSTNELVIDRKTTTKLKKSLDKKTYGPVDMRETNDKLDILIDLLSRPQDIKSSVSLNKKTFANIILELNRNGARLTV